MGFRHDHVLKVVFLHGEELGLDRHHGVRFVDRKHATAYTEHHCTRQSQEHDEHAARPIVHPRATKCAQETHEATGK